MFPDGGYVVKDDYGEIAHWEPFAQAYLAWIRQTQTAPFTRGDAAEHAAFLMGIASHGMADQVYDSTFMKRARVEDAAGWSDTLLEDFDTATDVALVADTGFAVAPELWVPSTALVDVYADVGYSTDTATLDGGQMLLHRVVLAYAQSVAGDAAKVAAYRTQYPWGTSHQLDADRPGSPPCEGAVVAAYWLALWDRLHDASTPQNLVIATIPSPGGAGHPTAASLVDAQVVIVFGHGIDAETLQIAVTDGAGQALPIQVSPWASEWTNVVRIVPTADWPADADLTVTVAAGLTTIDGLTADAPWSFAFSTRTGTPARPGADPTPHSGDPVMATESGGGCQVAAGADDAATRGPLALLLALGLVARRRRAR